MNYKNEICIKIKLMKQGDYHYGLFPLRIFLFPGEQDDLAMAPFIDTSIEPPFQLSPYESTIFKV